MKGKIWVGFCPKCKTRCSTISTTLKPYYHIICKKCLGPACKFSNKTNITITPDDYSFVLRKEEQKETICFDLDNTLCSQELKYENAKPFITRINMVNSLYDEGNIIIILTARGMGTGIDWEEKTKIQLEKWGLKYDSLHLTKPPADIYIDDKAMLDTAFFY
jgi:hypothetical protein